MPSASFFDMIEDEISGIDSTVAVTSRSAYSLRSAGTSCSVCPMKHRPSSASCLPEFLRGQIGAEARNRFQLVQRAAGVPERAARHHRHHDSRGRRQRRHDEAGLIAHAAGGVFVHLHAGNAERSTVSPECSMHSVRRLTSRSVIPEK